MITALARRLARFALRRPAHADRPSRPPAAALALAAALLLTLLAPAASAMMHPQMGRFLQRDPLGYVDGMSVYESLRSSPTKYLDPTGESSLAHPGNAALACEIMAAATNVGRLTGGTVIIWQGSTYTLNQIRSRNRSQGPSCQQSTLDRLNWMVKQVCKVRWSKPQSCTGNMSCEELVRNAKRFDVCKHWREMRDNKCWRGGDLGHRQQRQTTGKGAGNCWKLWLANCACTNCP